MKKILYLFLLFPFILLGQFNSNAPWNKTSQSNSSSFNNEVERFNEYFKTHDPNKKGSGFKPFKRWENLWENKLNSSGQIPYVANFWNNFNINNQFSQSRTVLNAPTSNWQPIGPIQNATPNTRARGRVNIIEVDPTNPNTIYMGTPAGGLWKTINGGVSWNPMTDNLPQIGVSGIAINPSNPNEIYISTGDKDAGDTYSVGVFKSLDGGLTWNTTGLTFTTSSNRSGDIVIHPTNSSILFCATSAGLYKTSDSGTTWSVVQLGNFSQGNVRFKPNDPTVIYATTNNRFYKSTNTGASFTSISSGLGFLSQVGRFVMDVSPSNADVVYILSSATNNSFRGVYKSSNSGTSFTLVQSTTDIFDGAEQAWFDLAIAVSDTNSDTFFTGCLNIYKSLNSGSTVAKVNDWNILNNSFTHADIHYLGYKNGKLYCGSDGGIYVSNDNGVTFSDITGNAQISQFYKISVGKNSTSRINGGTQDNGGYAFKNGLWRGYHGGDGMDNAVNPLNNDIYSGFLYYGQTLFVSNNAGESLIYAISGPEGEQGNWVTPLTSDNIGNLYAGFTKLYKLVDNSWIPLSITTIGTGNIDNIKIDYNNNNIIYVSNGTQLYKSIDGGVNFSLAYTAPQVITSIEVNRNNNSIIYLTLGASPGAVYKSINGGASFSNFSTGLPLLATNCIIHRALHTLNPLFVATALGVYYIDDTMTSWEPFETGLPNVIVNDLEINLVENKLIAGTYGRGVWMTDIPFETPQTDIEFLSITNPNDLINCNLNTIAPQITVKNRGLNTISNLSINYSINSNNFNFNWSGNIAPNNTQIVDLPTHILSRGTFVLNTTVTTTNDAFIENNTGFKTFYINDSGIVGVTNQFSSVNDELVVQTQYGASWQRGNRTSGLLNTNGNAAYVTNLAGNYSDGTKTHLVSQCYNLNNVSNPILSFKLAFDLELNWDLVYVEYSTNFGASWSLLGSMGSNWYNSDRTQATAGNDCFNCPGGQWTGTSSALTTYSYPLNSLNSESNIIFRIVFHADPAINQLGANIDDFVISGTLNSDIFDLSQSFVIYPNPSIGKFIINKSNIDLDKFEVYDINGRLILEKNTKNEIKSEIDLSNYQSGVYFVKLFNDTSFTVKRIIKN